VHTLFGPFLPPGLPRPLPLPLYPPCFQAEWTDFLMRKVRVLNWIITKIPLRTILRNHLSRLKTEIYKVKTVTNVTDIKPRKINKIILKAWQT
jgi:hypothetical protein